MKLMKHTIIMKQVLFSLLLAMLALPVFSQASAVSVGQQDSILQELPRDFRLRGAIVVANHSSYDLTKAVIHFSGGTNLTLGDVSKLSSGRAAQLAVPKGSWKKRLGGSTVSISLAGENASSGETAGADAFAVLLSEETGDLYVYVLDNDKGVIFKQVPKSLDLKDKIIIVNNSAYTIQQAAVAMVGEHGGYKPIAGMGKLMPGSSYEMVAYKDNGLAQLRGKIIALKIKGVKTDDDGESFVGSKPSYDFQASLAENRHDLYITVTSSGNGGAIMDF